MKESGTGFKKSLCIFLASVVCSFPHATMAEQCNASQAIDMLQIAAQMQSRQNQTGSKITKLWYKSFPYLSDSEKAEFEKRYITPRREFTSKLEAKFQEAAQKCDSRTLLNLSNELASSEDTLLLHLTRLNEETDKRRQREEAEAAAAVDTDDEEIPPEENEQFNEAVRRETGLTGASAVLDALSEPAEFLGGKAGEAGAGAVVGKDFNSMQEDLGKGRMEAWKSLTPESRADFSKKITQSTGNPATDLDN